MEQTTVLRDIGSLLKYLLKSQISQLSDENSITFNSPAEMEDTSNTKLSLYLYQVMENSQMRNSEPIYDSNRQQMTPAPVSMDLYYLLTPYAKDRETELIILENIIGLFHNELIIKNAGQATGDDLDEIQTLQKSLAATGNENLRVVPHNIPLEELNRLWERFSGKPYKMTASCLVTPARIPVGTVYPVPKVDKEIVRVRKMGGVA